MRLFRNNAYADLEGAPDWFVDRLTRHLSVPCEMGTKKGTRFGRVYRWQGEFYATLVLPGPRVASGLSWHVQSIATHYGVPCSVVDLRERPAPESWGAVRVPWRPYQDEVQAKVQLYGSGIVDAPPRSGKTLMAARALDELGLPALYVAPSVAIVRQTYEVMVKHFGEELVARLDGEALAYEKDITKPIVIATVPSALAQSPEWFKTRRVLIVDEFHHAAAESYHKLSALAVNAYYRLMFTGTHFRTGDDRLAMEAICSQVIHKIEMRDLVPTYLAPPKVFFAPVHAKPVRAGGWAEAYQRGIVECEERNALVVWMATTLSEELPTIVLTRRRAHADALGARITDSVVVKGGENSLTSRSVRDFLDGKYRVLVGTSVLGEGVDVPRASALVYACSGGDGVAMMQAYYRPLTAAEGKTTARIYDFYDTHHRQLRRWSEERILFARSQLGDCVTTPRV